MPEFKMSSGYRQVYRPDHPKASNDGYVFEHRLIAEEEMVKRPLKEGEVVLHLNGKKDDNRVENLRVLSRGEMSRIVANRAGKMYGVFVCPYCEGVFVREKRQSHLSKGTMGTFCSKRCSSVVGNLASQGGLPVEVLGNLEDNLIGSLARSALVKWSVRVANRFAE